MFLILITSWPEDKTNQLEIQNVLWTWQTFYKYAAKRIITSDFPSGDCPSGDYLSGDYPSGDFPSGDFQNVKFPKRRLPKWCNVPSGNFPKIRLANGILGAEHCAIGKLHIWEFATLEKPLGKYLPSFIDENRKK